MTTEEIRIECLKIAHAHGRSNAEVVERARAFEQYVVGENAKAPPGNIAAQRPPLGLPSKSR